jgi:hypothetical protein
MKYLHGELARDCEWIAALAAMPCRFAAVQPAYLRGRPAGKRHAAIAVSEAIAPAPCADRQNPLISAEAGL